MSPKLILMRHGRSAWNGKNIFTGWVDIPLDEKGVEEALVGGEKMQDMPIDVAYTSTLVRAHMTLVLALLKFDKVPVFLHPGQEWTKDYGHEEMLPVHMAAELNERYYGQLQGLNKDEMRKKYGEEQVHIWRRSFDVAPPGGESLADTAARTLPYFKKRIVPHLEKGENVFISAHGNSLRAIVMYLDGLTKEQVVNLEIPTGVPIIYTFERGQWQKSI